MPVSQGSASYSIGRDASVVLIHPLAPGGRLDLPGVTEFKATPMFTNLKSRRLDGTRLNADLPDGWDFSFNVERSGPEVDALASLIEAAWRSGGIVYSATVYQYVTEPDGSTSTWQYTDCSLRFPDLGTWNADNIVTQQIAGGANRRLAV